MVFFNVIRNNKSGCGKTFVGPMAMPPTAVFLRSIFKSGQLWVSALSLVSSLYTNLWDATIALFTHTRVLTRV